MTDWDGRFLGLAQHFAGWSKDPSTKVGAVIVGPRRIVLAHGYNGFPRGVDDSPVRLADRQVKYAYTVHAEPNAILNASGSVLGATIYTWPFAPCAECAKLIIQAGLARVVSPPTTPELAERWGPQLELARALLREAGLDVLERAQ